jgi:CheY-like chemotaxis protein
MSRRLPAGEEALDLAERRQFDIAILDMVMPGLSGLDVLAKLRVTSGVRNHSADRPGDD